MPASGNYWITGGNGSTTADEINVTSSPPAVINTVTLSQGWAPIDWTYAAGYMWGLSGASIYRTDLSSGAVSTFAAPSGVVSGNYGQPGRSPTATSNSPTTRTVKSTSLPSPVPAVRRPSPCSAASLVPSPARAMTAPRALALPTSTLGSRTRDLPLSHPAVRSRGRRRSRISDQGTVRASSSPTRSPRASPMSRRQLRAAP